MSSKSIAKHVAHDKPGHHKTSYGTHRFNIGNHRLEYTHKPCKNHSCKSYGQAHPNCKCYAQGGEVSNFCDQDHEHESDCQYFAGGGQVKSMNLSGFKKTKEDKKTVTMSHPNGHSITIMKSQISALQRKQMDKLPIHAAEGDPDVGNEASVPSMQDVADSSQVSPDLSQAIGPAAQAQAQQISSEPVAAPSQDLSYSNSPIQQKVISPEELASSGQATPTTAPQTTATVPAPASVKDPLANISAADAYGKEAKGIQAEAKAQSDLAKQNAQIERDQQENIIRAQSDWENSSKAILDNANATLTDIKNSHIKPNQYLENMGTGQKITTAIGLFLGGIGGALTHSGVNPASQWLDNQINKDVEAQKIDLENKKTVYAGYLDQYKNAAVADQMTRATQNAVYASKLRESAATAGSPMAQALALQKSAELEQKVLPLVNSAHLIQQASPFLSGSNGAQTGSEAQFGKVLQAAQTVNPELYHDLQSKYVPGVGLANRPVEGELRSQVHSLHTLGPLIDKAIAIQEKAGYTGTYTNRHPIVDSAEAASVQEALNAGLGSLSDNTPRGQLYFNFKRQIGDLGTLNLGGNLAKLKALKSQQQSDLNVTTADIGLKPFADSTEPAGLPADQQQKLNTFISNNPKYKNDTGTAVRVLRDKGII